MSAHSTLAERKLWLNLTNYTCTKRSEAKQGGFIDEWEQQRYELYCKIIENPHDTDPVMEVFEKASRAVLKDCDNPTLLERDHAIIMWQIKNSYLTRGLVAPMPPVVDDRGDAMLKLSLQAFESWGYPDNRIETAYMRASGFVKRRKLQEVSTAATASAADA